MKATHKGRKGQVPARLFMIFARESSTAVIFRRGPSRWVQLLKWNTKTDVFEPGQWFHGRIYERRSDLSPDGSLLIYFARRPGAKISAHGVNETEYTHAWTAISRPPFFTALALWPKGDCWNGGGLFKTDRVVLLNHKPEVARPHKAHQPQGLLVIPNQEVRGEDDPIFSQRLERDGWDLKVPRQFEYRGRPQFYQTVQAEVREKANAGRTHVIRLTRSIERLDCSEEFALRAADLSLVEIERAHWVDWDQQGRLVFARDGKIFAGSVTDDGRVTEERLVDLTPSKPEPLPAPEWATKW